MYDPTDGADDLIKKMEEDSKAELEAIDNKENGEEDVPQEPQDDKQDDQQDNVQDDAGEDDQEDDENDALSDEQKKRARAFAKQRNEAKQYREQLEAERAERQKLAERLAKLEGRSEVQAPQPKQENIADQEPDKDLYPDDHRDWKLRQLEKKLQETDKFRQQYEQKTQFEREVSAVQSLEISYKTSAPDYDDAVNFLVQREKNLKKMLNPALNDAQIDQMIQQEKVQLFKQIAQTGQNPADVVYKMAKNDGYVPKSKTQDAPKKDLTKIADNQRRAASLIGGSSAADTSGKMTPDQVFSKSMEDLFKMSDTDWKKAENSAR